MRLRALILDVDGTLADTEEAHRRAFNDAFREHGLDWNWSKPKYAHLLSTSGGKERLAAYIDSLPAAPDERRALTGRIADIHRTKTVLYTRMVDAGLVPLRDGVARLMHEATAAGVQLAIASTTTFANIEALLRTNLGPRALELFAVIGTGDQVRHKKPAPDIYDWVLRKLTRSAGDCAAIEDSANGLKAAKGAGLFTVVTPSYWTRTEDFTAADLVLPSLGSPDKPLTQLAAVLVGGTLLGIRELNRRLDNVRELGSAMN
jgi:beta-phosphoglucomutase-like phosphatase (HAD superfamily)